MALTKELQIQLISKDNLRFYYPGDILKGQVILNLKKPIEVQYISVKFHGLIEGVDSKISLINKTEHLAKPINGQKYTLLDNKQQHAFNFQFTIPTDLRLPSSLDIPKVGRVAYYLTAEHKKPKFKLSPTLSNSTELVEVLDIINATLPDYRIPVKMNSDLGFISGGKLTQWNCTIPKSAFIRGESITFECNMNYFPPMERQKAIKVSLIRQVHRTSTAKIIDCKVLSSKSIDLHITSASPASQSAVINLTIPSNTPPSVFPDSGRTLSISYLIQAELNMKGIKSTIKFKPLYKQEVIIVVGTFPNNTIQNRHALFCPSTNSSHVSLQTMATQNTSSILLPSNQSIRSNSKGRTVEAGRRNLLQQHISPELCNIKPLARLDENVESMPSKSYLPPYAKSLYSGSTSSTPSTPLTISSYQEAFDDYIPTTPLQKLPKPESRLSMPPVDRSKPSITQFRTPSLVVDRSLTPLPPIKVESEPIYHIRNNNYNTTRHHYCKSANNRPLLMSPNCFSSDVHSIASSPHEIGPNDIINKQAKIDTEKPLRSNDYFNNEVRRRSRPNTPPGLLHRQDTISTASSAGLADELF